MTLFFHSDFECEVNIIAGWLTYHYYMSVAKEDGQRIPPRTQAKRLTLAHILILTLILILMWIFKYNCWENRINNIKINHSISGVHQHRSSSPGKTRARAPIQCQISEAR